MQRAKVTMLLQDSKQTKAAPTSTRANNGRMAQGTVSKRRAATVTPTSQPKRSTKSSSKSSTKRAKSKAASPSLSFRPRVPTDDAFILQLTEEQLGEVHRQAFGEMFPREQFLQYIQSGAPTIVVELGGKRIGYYSYLTGQDGKMHVSALVIESAYQSDGIGTKVMQQLERDAAAHGVHTLEVFVQANNEKSMMFTRKLGFQPVYQIPPNSVCFQKSVVPVTTSTRPAIPAQGRPLW